VKGKIFNGQYMQTKTLSERIEELNKIKKSYEFEPTNNEFFKAMKVIEELQEELEAMTSALLTVVQDNAIIYDANARLKKENEALLAKNKELEEELQERKAYIVANPCAQCGGRINAMKCEAWAKKAKELEEKLKNNLEKTEECCPIETAEAAWNMSEVNEVERALEELKKYFRDNKSNHSELLKLTQNLVNSLEAEKTVMSKQEPKWLPMSYAPKCGSPITVKQSTNERHKIFKANCA
jgi:DNA repair exonuclease SbcCD ATPase subunit